MVSEQDMLFKLFRKLHAIEPAFADHLVLRADGSGIIYSSGETEVLYSKDGGDVLHNRKCRMSSWENPQEGIKKITELLE